eukprot:CAMPEP_0197026822 /NCGR_PEP_ID=MMETSP1384-20130603/6841_1 /TAXON_ID=29189 /ORGANISM="Ammonia sp." /LENGTH=155 /DNA_ID=CAMNT_0042455567 /DNA_START=34 /DNA_END=498 /DNA_ORIENTATION=-
MSRQVQCIFFVMAFSMFQDGTGQYDGSCKFEVANYQSQVLDLTDLRGMILTAPDPTYQFYGNYSVCSNNVTIANCQTPSMLYVFHYPYCYNLAHWNDGGLNSRPSRYYDGKREEYYYLFTYHQTTGGCTGKGMTGYLYWYCNQTIETAQIVHLDW